ncbi:unnamed protein product [Notodromas monacha]|uniref:phospholipase A2 n=1 Tax=Notodromas monacha TaxID=399045 RepID=A0A7R9GBA9_9CRUS|nr:unnamed protein product [Notodromas monacha]CAG0916306.1 unnamed protein product [Notodromas monacha]
MGCKRTCVQTIFKKVYYKLGRYLYRNPASFIIVPCFLTLIGAIYFDTSDNAHQHDLIIIQGGEVSKAHTRSKLYFEGGKLPDDVENSGEHKLVKREIEKEEKAVEYRFQDEVQAVIRTRNGSTIFTRAVFNKILAIHKQFVKFFGDRCRNCEGSKLLELDDIVDSLDRNEFNLTWPSFLHPNRFEAYLLPGSLGKPEVRLTPATMLINMISLSYKAVKERTQYEIDYMNLYKKLDAQFPDLEIGTHGANGAEAADKQTKLDMIKDFVPFAAGLTLAISIISSWQCDPLKQELSYVKRVGIDDTFVMLAAWRNTNPALSSEERMGQVFSDAAVAITVTSITDALSFWIGTYTPLKLCQVFCIYAGTGMIVLYFYQLFLFGATLAIFARLEERNRHSCFCVKLPTREQANASNGIVRCCCAGGSTKIVTQKPRMTTVTKIFRNYWAPFLQKTSTRVIVLITYLGYIIGGSYFLLGITVGDTPGLMATYDTPWYIFHEIILQDFSYLGPRFQVAIYEHLDYSDPGVQETIEKMTKELEAHRWIGEDIYTDSWIRGFKGFVRLNGEYLPLNVSRESEFVDTLRQDEILPRYTVQALSVAAAAMLAVAYLFIPSFSVALWIAFTMVSMQVGVAGYVVPLGAQVNLTVVIGLLMCIGFCVDFASHISYAFVTSESEDPAEKIKDALGKLGWPILQAACTTISGTAFLIAMPTYMYHVLGTITTFIMVFGLFHGLVILPILLEITERLKYKCTKSKNSTLRSPHSRPSDHQQQISIISPPDPSPKSSHQYMFRSTHSPRFSAVAAWVPDGEYRKKATEDDAKRWYPSTTTITTNFDEEFGNARRRDRTGSAMTPRTDFHQGADILKSRCQGPLHNIFELVYKRKFPVTSAFFPLMKDNHITPIEIQSVVNLLRTDLSWSIAHCLVIMDYYHLFSVKRLQAHLDELDNSGDAPIHLAMKLKRIQCFKALIAKGARLDILDKAGNTIFHFAATLGTDCMEALGPFKYSPLINMLNDKHVILTCSMIWGESPLYLACVSKLSPTELLDTVFYLLRFGSDPNMAMYGGRNTAPPVRTAGDLFGCKAITRLSRFDPKLSGQLFEDICSKYYDEFYAVEMKFGGNPLHWIRSRMPVLDLVRASCLLEARNFEGDTPFHMAVHNGHLDVCSALIGYGSNINARDLRGNTPLHIAVKYPSLFMSMLLICSGASPLHIASSMNAPKYKKKNLAYVLGIMGAKRCKNGLPLQCGKMCCFGGSSCPVNVLKARCTLAADCDYDKDSELCYNSSDSDCGPMRPRRQFDQVVNDLGNALGRTKLFKEGCEAPLPNEYQYFRRRFSADKDSEFARGDSVCSFSDLDELIQDEPEDMVISLGTEIRDRFKDRIISVPSPRGSAKILCLDGGGIRGLLTLQMLMCIEDAVGKYPLNLLFDWVCGTSTGAFLALLVAKGMPARDILRVYLNTKDRVFSGPRPYDSHPLEETLKLMLGPYTVMSDFNNLKVFITATMTDRFPAELHLFRAQGVYCDGGLVANNPTLDLLTELWEFNIALRGSNNPKHRILRPTLVVSLGTGLNIMEQHMDNMDIEFPDSVGALIRTVNNLKTLLKHVVELSTCTDFQVGDRARAWCGMAGIPYFRFNPTLFNYMELNETQDGRVVLAMFETKLYMMKNESRIREMVHHLI